MTAAIRMSGIGDNADDRAVDGELAHRTRLRRRQEPSTHFVGGGCLEVALEEIRCRCEPGGTAAVNGRARERAGAATLRLRLPRVHALCDSILLPTRCARAERRLCLNRGLCILAFCFALLQFAPLGGAHDLTSDPTARRAPGNPFDSPSAAIARARAAIALGVERVRERSGLVLISICRAVAQELTRERMLLHAPLLLQLPQAVSDRIL